MKLCKLLHYDAIVWIVRIACKFLERIAKGGRACLRYKLEYDIFCTANTIEARETRDIRSLDYHIVIVYKSSASYTAQIFLHVPQKL